MGSYAECRLDDIVVGVSKNDIDTELISLFRPQDKVVKSSPLDDVSKHIKDYQEALDEDPELKVIYYEAPVSIIRDRLDVLGYDLITAKEAFKSWVAEERKRSLELAQEYEAKDTDLKTSMRGYYQRESEILSELTPEYWIECLQKIKKSGIKTNYYGRYEGPHEDTAIGYMLSNDWYGFPGYDLFVPLRLVIEAFDNSEKLLYDITDLVWSGYFDYDDDFVEYGLDISASEYSSKSKTIVLTEGKSDSWVLSETLGILFPHLKDYYSFLDFENTGYGGGVGNLANVVKAFSGAGIVNNVIALFDNDTAAEVACRVISRTKIPKNISILRLPPLDLLKNYPTIGPSGQVELDVNGMAASIELYFGEDILKNGDVHPQ